MKALRSIWFLQVLAVMACFMASCGQPKVHPLPTIDIEVEDIPWDHKTHCFVTITDGETQRMESGKIKCRGGSSSAFPKHSFSLKLDHELSLSDLPRQRAWVLNANYIDKTMMHHKLCFDLFREMNPDKNLASRCAYVNVTMNGEYYGLFVLMQKLNAGSLGLDKKDSLAVIFKDPPVFWGDNRRENIQEPGNYFQQTFPDLVDEDRNGDLEAVMQFMLHADDSLFAQDIGNYFDLENVVDWHLLLMFTNNGDGVMKNFYLYKRDSRTPFRIAIWDCDAAFGRDCDGEYNMREHLPNFHRNLLLNRLQNNPYLNYDARLRQRYCELRDNGLFSKRHVEAMIKENDKIIRNEVGRNFEQWPVNSAFYYDTCNYEQELQIMRDYLKISIPQLDREMGY